jgi:hypothetical protein
LAIATTTGIGDAVSTVGYILCESTPDRLTRTRFLFGSI